MTYNLKPGLLSYCQGIWDSESGKFLENNTMDTIQCCLNNCKERIKFCFDTCHSTYGPNGTTPDSHEHNRCHRKCSELVNNCESVCLEYPSVGIDLISQCTTNKGCGTYPIFNRDCMESNKSDIIDCCRKGCIATSTVNCEQQCNDFYNHLAEGTNSPLTDIEKRYNLEVEKFKVKSNATYWVLYIVFLVILIILGLHIIIN